MAFNMRVRDPTKGSSADQDKKSGPTYWSAQNHTTDNYLRVEKWREDVKEFMFTPSVDPIEVPLTLEEARAMLRFRDDVKFFAALEDEKRRKSLQTAASALKQGSEGESSRESKFVKFFKGAFSKSPEKLENPMEQNVDSAESDFDDLWDIKAMDDANFLTRCFDKLFNEIWTGSDSLKEQLGLLRSVEGKLQDAIDRLQVEDTNKGSVQETIGSSESKTADSESEHKPGQPYEAFVKLSVRSPKDAALCSSRAIALIDERCAELAKSGQKDQLDASTIIRWASWKAMKVSTGAEALDLLLRSDRVYQDLFQQELFSKENQPFDISVHVAPFFSEFDPNWEFRGFVADGKKTCLTMYSPFTFVPEIAQKKDEILAVIQEMWDKVMPKIQSENYCVDFAVKPDLSKTWIVEVNNFLPPLAGTGLFVFQRAKDRDTLLKGPFEFRVLEDPLAEEATMKRRLDENTLMHYQVAPTHVLDYTKKLVESSKRSAK